ncbi:hypothetical protein N7448_002299 [Penicillium atrosanguineum]|uniref:Uncharacterized protein n=1 Tax=Penicillium atrosanguineum TaxID=1132637 RepID=A0A9W9PTZ5_9EURO|nr:uncharacterized protein N7443_005703 [Penicillium atrosanguineum]KAJ5128582.1 hypothetical protein N7526_006748 [Penicillium atrosanguineum]KAJ5144907.1 hypothetical protein N7448_002299 [Penicillium atrosanguineum]KAJ5300701.1 hypothetical protein N7443_005703 [Penicillium atrosanguineum]KAJ5311342.1 hypothetical protein N7476_007202 [Penicillium atrosanguineum]
MNKAITRPTTPARLRSLAERAPLKTGALAATEGPFSDAASEDEAEAEDTSTLPTSVVAVVKDGKIEQKDTFRALAPVALGELVSLAVPSTSAAPVALAAVENFDPAPAAVAVLMMLDIVKMECSFPAKVSFDTAAAAPDEV